MRQRLQHTSVLLIMLFMFGCNLPSTPTPPSTPLCSQSQLSAPALSSPAMWAVVDTLSPTLVWTPNDPSTPYPYDGCVPSGYQIHLRMGPNFSSDLGGPSYRPFTRNWTPSAPLLPGKAYEWSVAAFVGGENGPFADSRYFFTGPICETSALRAPRLLTPRNGIFVNTSNPLLVWEYRDPCIPEGYRIDLSTDPSFSDTSLSGGTGNPSTRWLPGRDLTDCTWYYWRVAPINGTTLGEFSNTRTFMVDLTGSCTYPLPGLTPILPTLVTIPTDPFPFIPIFTLSQNANCRIGPGVVFDVRRSYLKGDELSVEGINDARNWLYVIMPNEGNNHCWVSLSTGTLNGDPNQIPEQESPPTPVPTDIPTPKPTKISPQYNSCQDYTTQELCKSDPKNFGCYWGQNNSCVGK